MGSVVLRRACRVIREVVGIDGNVDALVVGRGIDRRNRLGVRRPRSDPVHFTGARFGAGQDEVIRGSCGERAIRGVLTQRYPEVIERLSVDVAAFALRTNGGGEIISLSA